MSGHELIVRRPGPLSTVQDLGRPGYAHLGVPPSGALDPDALRAANRAVGNDDSAAGLELTFGGLAVTLTATRYVALAGAPATLTIDGVPAPRRAAVRVPAGAQLVIGRPESGLRSYLAVAGGLTPPPVLGSRATDLLSGLGPAPLAAGTRLPLGEPTAPPSTMDLGPQWTDEPDRTLRLYPGPRADWFTDEARELLTTGSYRVSPQSNRIGLRLEGPPLVRRYHAELPSEGLVTGAVQVPSNGQPVLFLADHPTTGGYPVIGVVDPADRSVPPQARPGATLRYRLGSTPTVG